jgi:hypothetical protein
VGAYGFTVFNNGTFQVGPAQGQIVTGALQPDELSTINVDASAVAGDNLTGSFSCLSTPAVLGPQDTVTLTIPGKTPIIVYQGIVANNGNQCYVGNESDTLRLHDDMQTLLSEYYPTPFPTVQPSPGPTPTPVPTPTPTPTPTPIRYGQWGGQGVQLQASSQQGSFTFDCAHGVTDGPIVADSSGNFSVDGTYSLESGPFVNGNSRRFVATYSGNVQGNSMSLNVSYTDSSGNPVSNDYSLTFGNPGDVQTICSQDAGNGDGTDDDS